MRMFLLFIAFIFCGCATKVTMTGKPYAPVSPLEVKILFQDKPTCRFEELGFISTPLKWDQNHAIDAAREKAAEIGADYLLINAVHTNGLNDASVNAVAYKCLTVNRDKVETRME